MELKWIASRAGRLSSFLREEMQMSSGLMNRLKWQQQLYVNGIPVHTDYPVQPGDVITVPLDEPEPEYPAEAGPLTVLFEDAYLLAVDKPAGMLIHPSRSCFTGTLANRVMGYYRQTGQSCAFHPLTRLDRDTFGVVLLAKNAHIHNLLNQLHLQDGFCKTYHALVFGCPAADSGEIDAPIARLPLPSLLRQVHPQGKPCLTRYQVLEHHEGIAKLALHRLPDAPISFGCTVPIWVFPFWATPSTALPNPRPFPGHWASKPNCCAPKRWHFPIRSPEKPCALSPGWR